MKKMRNTVSAITILLCVIFTPLTVFAQEQDKIKDVVEDFIITSFSEYSLALSPSSYVSGDSDFFKILEARQQLIRQRKNAFSENDFYSNYTSQFTYEMINPDTSGDSYEIKVIEDFELDSGKASGRTIYRMQLERQGSDWKIVAAACDDSYSKLMGYDLEDEDISAYSRILNESNLKEQLATILQREAENIQWEKQSMENPQM